MDTANSPADENYLVENVHENKKQRKMAVDDSVEMYKNECDVVVHGEEVLWLEVVGDSYRSVFIAYYL